MSVPSAKILIAPHPHPAAAGWGCRNTPSPLAGEGGDEGELGKPGVAKLTLASILRHPPLQISQWGSKFLLPPIIEGEEEGRQIEVGF